MRACGSRQDGLDRRRLLIHGHAKVTTTSGSAPAARGRRCGGDGRALGAMAAPPAKGRNVIAPTNRGPVLAKPEERQSSPHTSW